METNEEFWARRRRQERELERQLNRDLLPILLPMVIATGAGAGLLFAIVFFPPLPREFVGIFLMLVSIVGLAPVAIAWWKYR